MVGTDNRPIIIYLFNGSHRMTWHEVTKGIIAVFKNRFKVCIVLKSAVLAFSAFHSFATALLYLYDSNLYRVGQKSKLLILSEYVNKTEKVGGKWTNKNSYRENEALADIFTWNILSRLFWKQSMKLLLGKQELAKLLNILGTSFVNMTSWKCVA